MKTDDGLSWLDNLADQFEQAAREIRAVRSRISTLAAVAASSTLPVDDGVRIRIGEAIREVLVSRGQSDVATIIDAIDWRRVVTRSKNRSGIVAFTLKKNPLFRRVSRGVWDIDGR